MTGPTPTAEPRVGCTGTTEVDVAVDPSLAEPLTRTVGQTVQPALRCVRLAVTVRPSAEVAAGISRRSGPARQHTIRRRAVDGAEGGCRGESEE